MRKQVIDASVAAKWVFPEEGSEAAEQLLEAMVGGQVQLIAPDSYVSELGNIAWKKAVLRKEVSLKEARDGLRFLLSVLPRLVPSPLLLEDALEIAVAHRRSVHDSLYVALARQEQCELVTADQSLRQALERAFPFIVGLPLTR